MHTKFAKFTKFVGVKYLFRILHSLMKIWNSLKNAEFQLIKGKTFNNPHGKITNKHEKQEENQRAPFLKKN